MKSLLVLLFVSVQFNLIGKAQTCEGYFPQTKDVVMEITSYSEKGKKQTTNTLTKNDVKTVNGVIANLLLAHVLDEKKTGYKNGLRIQMQRGNV